MGYRTNVLWLGVQYMKEQLPIQSIQHHGTSWDVIKCAKLYYSNPFRGYDVAEGQIVAFPTTLCAQLQKVSLPSPCSRHIWKLNCLLLHTTRSNTSSAAGASDSNSRHMVLTKMFSILHSPLVWCISLPADTHIQSVDRKLTNHTSQCSLCCQLPVSAGRQQQYAADSVGHLYVGPDSDSASQRSSLDPTHCPSRTAVVSITCK